MGRLWRAAEYRLVSLDSSIIGVADETMRVRIEAERLQSFAEAIGETRELYLDRSAARAAGYPDIPVPPTFHFSIGLERNRPFGMLEDRGIDMRRLLHAEQSFLFRRLAFAGEEVSVARRVSDYFEKKAGALRFAVIETDIRNASGEQISVGREVLVLPHKAPSGGSREHHPVLSLSVGREPLGPLYPGTVTREMLARFGAASGDLNRIHLDPTAARIAGYDNIFAHGMLCMAWLGRLLTNHFRQESVRDFSVRFRALTPVGASPVCDGHLDESGGKADLRIHLDDRVVTLTGSATIAV